MLVTDIAKRAGVSAHTVRYYERIGLLDATRHAANRYRSFGVAAVERLRFVQQAKRLGFSLAEIRKILDTCDTCASPCPLVREIVRARIVENAARIRELERLQCRLEQALRRWARMPDGAPDADAICHLIESLGTGDA